MRGLLRKPACAGRSCHGAPRLAPARPGKLLCDPGVPGPDPPSCDPLEDAIELAFRMCALSRIILSMRSVCRRAAAGPP